ncbi:hypothetical protein [Actinocorallia longicatena]|uniref:Uncharacterized protein n=1 Tax=Actinocorallia longicatena TaxID=111803 RepID=A0ABP6QEZ9_9ACTN
MATPAELERRYTLLTAVGRYDALRTREVLAAPDEPDIKPLGREECLELLALGEVIAKKAAYGQQLSVRAAREAGASWADIGAALDVDEETARRLHERWLEGRQPRDVVDSSD